MKLKNAAQITAYRGRSMRVETSVAIEFAVSCRPLRKSNASATAIRPIRTGRLSAAVMARGFRDAVLELIEHDRIDLVGDVLEAVDDFFQGIVELGADDERHRIALVALL